MGRLEERLRRLEERLVLVPSIEEYLDASNREEVRALHKLAGLLAARGFDGSYLFTEADRRMLAEDTQEQRERDRETIEAWRKGQGLEVIEGAKEKLLAKLEARS